MAPTPQQNDSPMEMATNVPQAEEGYWTKRTIAMTVVFGALAFAIVLALSIFVIYRRRQKQQQAAHHALAQSDKAGLLDNEDKSSMFSRNRESSVTLYADHDDLQKNRYSMETVSLMPLQPTPPAAAARDPMNTTDSAGSGVSAVSRGTTGSSMLLSPISPSEDGDLGMRPTATRARSSSTASQKARYYDTTPTNTDLPPIPTIVHTPSDEDLPRGRLR